MSGHRELGVRLVRCNVVEDQACVHDGEGELLGHVWRQDGHWIAGDERSRPLRTPVLRTRLEAINELVVRALESRSSGTT